MVSRWSHRAYHKVHCYQCTMSHTYLYSDCSTPGLEESAAKLPAAHCRLQPHCSCSHAQVCTSLHASTPVFLHCCRRSCMLCYGHAHRAASLHTLDAKSRLLDLHMHQPSRAAPAPVFVKAGMRGNWLRTTLGKAKGDPAGSLWRARVRNVYLKEPVALLHAPDSALQEDSSLTLLSVQTPPYAHPDSSLQNSSLSHCPAEPVCTSTSSRCRGYLGLLMCSNIATPAYSLCMSS